MSHRGPGPQSSAAGGSSGYRDGTGPGIIRCHLQAHLAHPDPLHLHRRDDSRHLPASHSTGGLALGPGHWGACSVNVKVLGFIIIIQT